MASDEFDKVELPALEQLQSLGWSYVTGEKLSPEESDERNSFKDVVLEKRLTTSIKRLNPWISNENLRKVIRNLTKTVYPNLVEANQSIWNSINQCVSVMQDLGKGNKGQTVHIIDFDNLENNEFICTNQFKIKGVNQSIIPDIVLFVNGLPLAVIECKSPYITDPMEEGIDQLLRYSNRRNPSDDEGAEMLFHYNLMMVSTHKDKARVGTITSHTEHFLEWKEPYPLTKEEVGSEPTSQEILIAGLFSRENFLDILQNFTVFEPVGGRILKKIPRYQQFRAVHRTIERIKTGKNREEKGGVIWHTQGSGKSLTMVFLTLKIRRDPGLRDYKLVFLTDRVQLDNQLAAVFQTAQNETVHQAGSINHLKELLSRDSSDIVMATVQKFQEEEDELKFPVLNKSEKIIILADEAHRTHYGLLGVAINTGLPKACRIAFTGTPLIRSQKTTKTFGSYIDTYTIEEAVRDGATVQILYEGREPAVKVTGDSLDSLFDEYFEDRSAEEREAIKKKFGTTNAVLEAPMRIRRVCIDIVKHYRGHIQPNGFKAMVVTSSRNAAITYKEQLDELGAPRSAVIISADHNDGRRFLEHTNSGNHKKQIEDFKKPLGYGEGESDLSILIVKDMLLTGFDAPIAQVMYLDTKLVEHNLLQAIARVNRIGKNKFRGFIVDYYGLSDYLTEALEMFSTEDVTGALIELKEEIPRLKNAHTRVMKYFNGLDSEDTEACVMSLEDETKRQSFQADFRIFSRQMDIILPDSAAAPFLNDLKWLGKISVGARNLYRDEQLNISGAGEKVRKLIEEHVYSTGVDPKIPPVDLLAADYREKLSHHKSSRSKASEIEHAIRHHIKINLENDPEYYRKLSERLEEIIRKCEEKWDELVQLLLDFRGTIESGREKQAEEHGLTTTEQPFYNILMAELTSNGKEMSMDAQTQEKVKEVTRSLVAMLDEATQIVDFFDKWDEQRRVKRKIRRVIIENFDDESLVKPVTDRFMELAEVKFK